MLTWAVTFLLLAIFSAVFGFVAVGPLASVLFVVFFSLFIWSLIRERADRHSHKDRP
jgi:uncharacterized membrane protein YtjA (UPF0391 family)